MSLLIGLVTGILFGILLQRSEMLRFDRQVGALLFRDMTIIKFMFAAIVVAMVGIYLCVDLGLIKLSIKATGIGAQVVGGSLFGIGWAILGYCPGTAGGALGEGRVDAGFGILGMLFGASIYGALYSMVKGNVLAFGKLGKITLPSVLGINHWIMIVFFIILVGVFFWWLEKEKL